MNGKKPLDLLERTDVKLIEEAEKNLSNTETDSSSNNSDDCEKMPNLNKGLFFWQNTKFAHDKRGRTASCVR